MSVTVVTIAHARHGHLLRQLDSLMAGDRQPDHHVVVAMNDRPLAACVAGHPLRPEVVDLATEGADLPLARARNLGVRRAVDQGADVVVLLDVDCLAGRELVTGYVEAVRASPNVVWSGPVTYLPPPPLSGYDVRNLTELDDPHPARPVPGPGVLVRPADPDLFWSLSFAVHAATWERIGGFCEEYTGYGAEDTDFARLALVRGAHLGWTGTARAYHQHHPTYDPPVQHLDSILRNAALFHRRWWDWPMQGWLREFERLGLAVRTATGWERCGTETRSRARVPAHPG
jgi:N-acetylglucosaminyl-diphospho-decaprenol L-rhamnosyltransferase